RQAFDLRRPLAWLGSEAPKFSTKLPAPPKHEWLEAVRYWNAGGRAPVWFVVDPKRNEMEILVHGNPDQYRWAVRSMDLLGGVRPNEMDWYRVERPEWYVGSGWSLTPEAAGVAMEDHLGPGIAPIEGWIRRRSGGVTLLVGGRNLGNAPSP